RLQMWDISDLRAPVAVANVDYDQDLTSMAFSSDGRALATTSTARLSGGPSGSRLQLWEISDLRKLVSLARVVDHDQEFTSVTCSPGGRTLATTSATSFSGPSGGWLQLWDISNLPALVSLVRVVDDDSSYAISAAFSPNSPILVTSSTSSTSGYLGSSVGRLRIWDVSNLLDPVRLAVIEKGQCLTSVAFSPNGPTLVTSSAAAPSGGRPRLSDTSNPRAPVLNA